MNQGTVAFTNRLSDYLHEWLKAAAGVEDRSLNKTVAQALRYYLEHEHPDKKPA